MSKKIISQEQNFYEKYWQNLGKDGAIFEDVPIWEEKELLRVENLLGSSLKGRVLDVGCGNGVVARYLSKIPKVKELVGVDISPTAIEICRASAKKEKSMKTQFLVGSVTDLPFKDQAFDTVYSFEVIEHIIDVEKMLAECNRVLKLGGHFGLSTVELNFPKRMIVSLFLFEKYFSPKTPHIRFFTRNSLEKILKESGFKVIKYGWTNSYLKLMPMGQMILAKKVKSL